MTQTPKTKARIQYSSQDKLDVAVINYCRGESRHDLHARMRTALNGCYGPFAMAAVQAPKDEIRRQALRSIQQLTSQILEIKERFLPDVTPLRSQPPKGSTEPTQTEPTQTWHNPEPTDQPLREFLGTDAAIMAGINPFLNDLT